MTDHADVVQFIQVRIQTASEWFDEQGEQLLASEMHECFAALDALVAERDEAKRLLREADECWAEQGVAALANEEKP